MSETPETPRFVDQAKRYKLGSRIATGGMGEVWRAEDTVLNRTVAVKLLKNEYADDSSFRARFESEARNAAALHHPNVAAVFDFGEAPAADPSSAPRPYLVMELVDGRPLSDLIRPGNPMDPDAMRELLAQAADAIGAAHTAGIVHRDVKPANLLVTPDRRVKITDFGIARATEGMALTATGQVMGTPQYLSPEQAQGRGASPASDVYSLGVVAFECLAGRRPFEADSPVATALAHVREPVPDLPDDVPADLAAVVYKTMEKDPEARFPDGRELASALRDPATAATMIAGAGAGDGGRTSVLPGAAAGAGLGAAAGYAAGRGSQGDASPGTRGMDTQGAGAAGAAGGAGAAGSGAAPTDRDQRSSGSRAWLWALLAAAGVVIVILLVTQLTGGGDDDEPTPEPTRTPTQTETETETPTPTQEPAPQPTREPTTESPTEEPTTESPTEEPTTESPSTPTSPSSPATQPSSQDPTGTPTPDTAPSEDASPSVSQVGEEPDGSDEGTSAGSASRPVWHPSTGQGDR